MSRARLRTALVALVLAVPMSVSAQASGDGRMDRALRRVRAADSLLQVRRAEYDAARLAAAPREQWVVLRDGDLTVRATAAIAEPVRGAMRQVMSDAADRGGSALGARLARRLPTVVLDTSLLHRIGASVRLIGDTSHPRMETTRRAIGRRLREADLVPRLAMLVDAFALDGADSALSVWTLDRRLPMTEPADDEWTEAYLDLATSESYTLRQCRLGVAAACLTSLGVLGDEAPDVTTWYAPEDFRHLVRMVGYSAVSRQSAAQVAQVRACLDRHEATACQAVAARIPPARVPAPLGTEARRTFVDEVLRAGGAGAYDRLLATPGTVRDRLRTAAGRPLEEVALQWRARVVRARPEAAHVNPLLLLSTVAWCGAFVGIAAIRRVS